MIYHMATIKEENAAKIADILEQLEIDIGEDPEKSRAQLFQQVKDLGELDLYNELMEM